MDSSEIIQILNSDLRQTESWARYIESRGFKTVQLNNGSFLHEFNLGNFTILKSFRPIITEESIQEIEEVGRRKNNLVCKISPNYSFDEELRKKYNYQNIDGTLSATKTCIIDLTRNIDDIYQDFSENTRYKINRSIRERDRVEIINNPTIKDLDKFYDSLNSRQKSKNFITFPRKEIKLLSGLFKENSFLISSYDKNNQQIVSNLYFKSQDKITYFAGSLNTFNHKSKAGYQMIFEAIKFFKSLGVKIYDFEGIKDERNKLTNDWDGFTNFKLKFGKTIISYPLTIIKYNNFYFRQMVKIFGA
jgi:lipid II:glycine glycyltransferase (peptidoglycan interpeptide bridge formation enzyme)